MNRLDIAPLGITETRVANESSDGGVASIADHSIAQSMVMQLVRERMLSHALGIQVTIDRTGWIRGQPEVVIHHDDDGSIYPLRVKMSPETRDEDILGTCSVNAHFTEYNRLIRALQQLEKRAAAQIVRLSAPDDSAVARVHRDLAQLPNLIARRQARTMGNRTVGLDALRRELDFMRHWELAIKRIVVNAENREQRRIAVFIKRLAGFAKRAKGHAQLS